MADGVGQRSAQRGGGARRLGEQGPPRRRERVERDDAQQGRLAQGPLHDLVAQPPAPPRRPPRQQAGERVGGPHGRSRRQLGEAGEHPAPVSGGRRPARAVGQRGDRPPGVVPGADEPRHARQVEPGAGQRGPLLLRAPGRPDVGRGRRHPLGRDAVALPHQVRRHGDLDEQRGRGLVGVDLASHPSQLPHTEAARTQRRRGRRRPERDQLLDLAQRPQRGARRRAVHRAHPAVDGREVRRAEGERAQRPVAAQREPDLAGQLHGLGVDPHQQPAGEQPGDGVRRARTAAAPDRRPGCQRLEHSPLVRVDGGEQLRQGGRRGDPRRGPAEATGKAGDDVADRRDERDAGPLGAGRVRVDRVPRQRARSQRGERRVEDGRRQARPEQPADVGRGDRRGVRVRDDERVEDVQGDRVEVVARPVHRRADAGPRGQHGQVGGRGHGEVRPQPEQVGQRVVVLGTQPVDQRGGHRPPR